MVRRSCAQGLAAALHVCRINLLRVCRAAGPECMLCSTLQFSDRLDGDCLLLGSTADALTLGPDVPIVGCCKRIGDNIHYRLEFQAMCASGCRCQAHCFGRIVHGQCYSNPHLSWILPTMRRTSLGSLRSTLYVVHNMFEKPGLTALSACRWEALGAESGGTVAAINREEGGSRDQHA
jgi:hypothetical protein